MIRAALVCALLAGCAHSTPKPAIESPSPPVKTAKKGSPADANARYQKTIKEVFAKAWVPALEKAACRNDPEGTEWSTVDRSTTIAYHLDRSGMILGTRLVKASGAPYLDALALQLPLGMRLEAPPGALFEHGTREDGTVELEFRFTVFAAAAGPPRKTFACSSR